MKRFFLIIFLLFAALPFAQETDNYDVYDGYDTSDSVKIVEGEATSFEEDDSDNNLEEEMLDEPTEEVLVIPVVPEQTIDVTIETITETVTNMVVLTNTAYITNTNIVSIPNIAPISVNACVAILNEKPADLEAFYRLNPTIITNTRADGNSLLHLAATKKNSDMINFLVTQGSDINLTNKEGQTPLHIAAIFNNSEATKLLLQGKANPWLKDHQGNTPLGIANIKKYPFVTRLLIQASTNMPPEEKEKKIAEFNRPKSTVPSNFDLYKNFTKKITDKGPILDTPWHKALYRRGHLGVQRVTQMGMSPYDKDKFGQNAFHLAALYDNIDALKFLLLSFPMKNNSRYDNFGATPLHIASGKASPELTSELINSGCSIDIKNKGGWTPLFEAIFLGNQDNVILFLKNGISPNMRTPKGRTPLHEAALQGNAVIVRELLNAGALFNVSDFQGNTPFFLAAQQGHIDVLSLLVDQGADPNTTNKDEMNALHVAVRNNQKDIVNFLINIAKINIYQPDINGQTALDIAYINGFSEIINMLAIPYTAE
ncbi:MAG: ankyrin repeat domain-containing protein [Brevinema sp.]